MPTTPLPMPNPLIRAAVCLALFGCLAPATYAAIKVEKSPVVVVRKTFDPKRPPKEMPPLKKGEAALTDFHFNCATNVAYEIQPLEETPEHCKATVRVTDVTVTAELRITIWLPHGASDKLKAHEEGHREIGEIIYKNAEQAAREAAKHMDGRELTVEGKDCKTAAKAAIQKLSGKLCQQYLAVTAGRASRVGDRYDALTDHGRKKSPDEAEAIKQAFAEEGKG